MTRIIFIGLLLAALTGIAAPARSEQAFPPADWQDRPNPLASPYALPGGELAAFAGQYPKSLNYYLDNNSLSAEIFGALYDTLLTMNPATLEYEPALAARWTISDDKRTFTFFLDPAACWSDGRPVTALDVKWTFDALVDPKNLTGPFKVALEDFLPPELIDERTIRFTARRVHWRNLGAVGGLNVLPRAVFAGVDFNTVNFEFPVVSGSYRLGQIDEGVFLTLERRGDWWMGQTRRARGFGNFQTLRFRFFAEHENAFEAFKKGQLDLFPIYMARLWVKDATGKRINQNWIVKQKIYNRNPIGFQGFAMNMRRPPFDDIRVRKAMAYALNRRKMNRTLMYEQYFMHRSYFEDLYDPEHPCPNPAIEFDKEKARQLFSEAGWQVNPQTGWREKQGRRLSIKFLSRSAGSDKFLAIYAEDLKDLGVELIVDKKDWAAWAKDMDSFDYEMTWAAWASGFFKDPEGMWSSREADRRSGNNITGFKDPEVDRLIEQQKEIFSVAERNEIYRRIDRIVYSAFPYVLLWNINYTRLLYWNRFGTPPAVLSKYGNESAAYWYWWADPDLAADLEDAMAEDLPLPPRPPTVHYKE